MFTTNNRRNRTAAIITIAAATAIFSSADFAAPKRDVGRGHNRQVNRLDVFEVEVVHPATPPNGSGNHDVTVGGMRNRNDNIAPEPGSSSGTIVTITTPSPFPTGGGTDITASAMRNRNDNIAPEPGSSSGTIVTITTPSPFPTGGGTDITASAMRNRNDNIAPEPGSSSGSIVTITTPSPFPAGGGTDITAGAMSNREFGRGHRRQDVFEVKLVHPATPPSGSGDHDITAGALIAADNGSSLTGSAASSSGSAPTRGFLQSLDMTSSVRYVGKSTAAASARNPFADGRAWVTLDRDAQNGFVATAGWSFLLK